MTAVQRPWWLIPVFVALILGVTGFSAPPSATSFVQELARQLVLGDDGSDADHVRALRAFYESRQGRPIFTGPDGLTSVGDSVTAAIDGAGRDGLEPADYPVVAAFRRGDAAGQAEVEISLGTAFLRYAVDMTEGRAAPEQATSSSCVNPAHVDLLDRLAVTADPDRFIASLPPANPEYRRLRRALAAYQRMAAADGWPSLPDGPLLRLGDVDARVDALRARLAASGDLTVPVATPEIFDEGLVLAVRSFQTRHGLEPDGIVGPQTRRALNASVFDRIRQIIANMERWRGMPDDLGHTHVLVNVAAFELAVIEDGRQVMRTPIVVGRRDRPTPVFSGAISFLEFNPFWNVPPRLAVRDIVPKAVEDPAYIADQGFRLFGSWAAQAAEVDVSTVDWAEVGEQFPYKLRQDPGENNALGQVKFMFPNEHNVYMHDTPARDLFDARVRTFSSGCIRVAEALDLAAFLLSDSAWDQDRIDATLNSGETAVVTVEPTVPVHITYSTVWVGEGGTVHFRDDIYDRDGPLLRSLYGEGVAASGACEPQACGDAVCDGLTDSLEVD